MPDSKLPATTIPGLFILHSSLCRLEAEISEVLGRETHVGEEELEKLQYTEQVCLEDLATSQIIVHKIIAARIV